MIFLHKILILKKKNMNKYILALTVILFSSSMSVDAQANVPQQYKVTSLDGDVFIRQGNNPWEVISSLNLSLFDTDSIKIARGFMKWCKVGTQSKPLYKTPAISVLEAWKTKETRNARSMYGIKIHQSNDIQDTIRFCFITAEGVIKSNNIIDKDDTLVAMMINHSKNDTLYAYAYWEYYDEDGNLRLDPMSSIINDSICIIEPLIDNVFRFNIEQHITSNDNSNIYLLYSSKPKPEPKGKWPNTEMFFEDMSAEGFDIRGIEIQIQK